MASSVPASGPVLWSFRRCPYAMRARLAIQASGQRVELREILLRDKPEAFLQASRKATVPVLVLPDGRVIEESRDIISWALAQADPEGWLAGLSEAQINAHFEALDGPFKHHLDRYKYASRYDAEEGQVHREAGAAYLQQWNKLLAAQTGLSGDRLGLLDFATLPFVRQFRIADIGWFDAQDWPNLHRWLQDFLNSPSFAAIMQKYAPWQSEAEPLYFPS